MRAHSSDKGTKCTSSTTLSKNLTDLAQSFIQHLNSEKKLHSSSFACSHWASVKSDTIGQLSISSVNGPYCALSYLTKFWLKFKSILIYYSPLVRVSEFYCSFIRPSAISNDIWKLTAVWQHQKVGQNHSHHYQLCSDVHDESERWQWALCRDSILCIAIGTLFWMQTLHWTKRLNQQVSYVELNVVKHVVDLDPVNFLWFWKDIIYPKHL